VGQARQSALHCVRQRGLLYCTVAPRKARSSQAKSGRCKTRTAEDEILRRGTRCCTGSCPMCAALCSTELSCTVRVRASYPLCSASVMQCSFLRPAALSAPYPNFTLCDNLKTVSKTRPEFEWLPTAGRLCGRNYPTVLYLLSSTTLYNTPRDAECCWALFEAHLGVLSSEAPPGTLAFCAVNLL
jgi:hypothetical protein